MHALSIVFWAVTSLTGSTLGAGAQQLLATTPGVVGRQSGAGVESKRNLQGRFLHITGTNLPNSTAGALMLTLAM